MSTVVICQFASNLIGHLDRLNNAIPTLYIRSRSRAGPLFHSIRSRDICRVKISELTLNSGCRRPQKWMDMQKQTATAMIWKMDLCSSSHRNPSARVIQVSVPRVPTDFDFVWFTWKMAAHNMCADIASIQNVLFMLSMVAGSKITNSLFIIYNTRLSRL